MMKMTWIVVTILLLVSAEMASGQSGAHAAKEFDKKAETLCSARLREMKSEPGTVWEGSMACYESSRPDTLICCTVKNGKARTVRVPFKGDVFNGTGDVAAMLKDFYRLAPGREAAKLKGNDK
ncbi:MAG: hypothetical protein HQL09_09745 [Nitrospirae bacterium]|nr:hypothetical protein [Nitrospirota bacterium]